MKISQLGWAGEGEPRLGSNANGGLAPGASRAGRGEIELDWRSHARDGVACEVVLMVVKLRIQIGLVRKVECRVLTVLGFVRR